MKTENNANQNQNNETYTEKAKQNAQGRRSYAEIDALAARAAAGERAAEETLFLAFKPLIVKLAAPFPDFEDAKADGALWLIEAVRAFDPGRGVYFPVYVKRTLSAKFRARWRRFRPDDVPFEEKHGGAADNIADAEAAAERQAQINRLAAAIPELSELEQAIITCAFEQSMTREAIAKSRGISLDTVKTAKRRAMRKLRKLF